MDTKEYIYCIENSWLNVNCCRNVYVSFYERLSEIKIQSFTNILTKHRTIASSDREATHYDIVYEALQEFYEKWGIWGKITDGVTWTILY